MAQTLEVTLQTGSQALPVILGESTESVSVKMRTEATYYDDGYEAGKEDGRNEYITDELPAEKTASYNEGEAKGYEDGTKEEYDKLWDAATSGGIQSGGAYDLSYRFSGQSWTYDYESLKDTFVPPIGQIIKANTGTAAGMFRNCRITNLTKALEDRGAVLDTSQAKSLTYAFAYGYLTDIPKVDLRGTATNTESDHGTGYIFAQAQNKQKLKTIREIVVNENVVLQSTSFHQCGALEEIHFTGKFNSPFYFNKTPALKTFTFEKTTNTASGKINGVNAVLKPVNTTYYISGSEAAQKGYVIDLSKCASLSVNSLRHIILGLQPWRESLGYTKPTLLINQEQKDQYFTSTSKDYLYMAKGEFDGGEVPAWGAISYITNQDQKNWKIEVSQN